jgi:hypothetical protein
MKIGVAAVVSLLTVLSLLPLKAQNSPVPSISLPLEPMSTVPGSPGFTLNVSGTGFAPTDVVYWNRTKLSTTFIDASHLTATVPASDVSVAGTAAVATSSGGLNGPFSNVADFEIGTPSISYLFPSLGTGLGYSGTQSIVTGDFNRDGKLDLVTTNFSFGNADSVCILLGNGDGSFREPYCYTGTQSWASPAVGDFNGDGNLDLAVLDSFGNTVNIFLGNGDGTLRFLSSFAVGPNPISVVACDFNRDGRLDLAIANRGGSEGSDNETGSVSILLGLGDGSFGGRVNYNQRTLVTGLAAGDYTGDGLIDLLTVNLTLNSAASSICILAGKGDGSFGSPSCFTTGNQNWQVPIPADFNNDGKLDLAVAAASDSFNNVSIFLGNGDGTFRPEMSFPTGIEPVDLAVADLNADGKLDIVTANASSDTFSLLLGNGDGTLENHLDFAAGQQSSGVPAAIVAGDFNQDGKVDVAISLPEGSDKSLQVLLQGLIPVASLNLDQLTFNDPVIGVPASAQYVVLENSGTAPLMLTDIQITGPDARDYSQYNECASTLEVGENCHIRINFTPVALGTRTATLKFNDNAPGNPQAIPLTGIVQDFVMAPASPTTVSVISGKSATYLISLSPEGGFSSTVTLTCSETPEPCTTSPSLVVLDVTAPSMVAVTVNTANPVSGLRDANRGSQLRVSASSVTLLGMLGLAVCGSWKLHLFPGKAKGGGEVLATNVLSVILLMTGCGGELSRIRAGTQPGSYNFNITATATAGSAVLTHSVALTLVVH